MESSKIVPEIIDQYPSEPIKVTYEGQHEVNFGAELTPDQVKHAPVKITWSHEPQTFYTLAMIDIDAISKEKPVFREVNHWFVVNILGNDVENGDTLMSYVGSGPPENTGLHRYVFLVYRQKNKIDLEELKRSKLVKKMRFSVRDFSVKFNLGSPVAGNFFVAKWDASVNQGHGWVYRCFVKVVVWFINWFYCCK